MSDAFKGNVIRLSQKRPDMALERLKRSTGLDFDAVPQSLAHLAERELKTYLEKKAPILTDIVNGPVWAK